MTAPPPVSLPPPLHFWISLEHHANCSCYFSSSSPATRPSRLRHASPASSISCFLLLCIKNYNFVCRIPPVLSTVTLTLIFTISHSQKGRVQEVKTTRLLKNHSPKQRIHSIYQPSYIPHNWSYSTYKSLVVTHT